MFNLNSPMKRVISILLMSLFVISLVGNSYVSAENDGTTNEKVTNEINFSYLNQENWYDSTTYFSREKLEKTKIPREVKGLYVTGHSAANERFPHFVDLLNNTELNSLVIDVKEDSGYLTYKSNVPNVKEISSDRSTFIKDIDEIMVTAKQNNIYTIARIVTFKDPFFAGAKPEIAMQKKTGGVWRDRKGISWVDPYNKEVWDYNIAIAKEAAERGFKEIQFDYVRYPENGKKVDAEVTFVNPDNLTKAENIAAFLAYAKEQLKDYPVYISADVFGLVTTVKGDMGIGQQWELITPVVDYISPMMYPSHYANRTYGLSVPDAYPYETIKYGLIDAINKDKKLQENGKSTAIIRPWYQDFTATWVPGNIKYGSKEVSAQITAGYELGVNEYIIWNAGNRYSEGAWLNK